MKKPDRRSGFFIFLSLFIDLRRYSSIVSKVITQLIPVTINIHFYQFVRYLEETEDYMKPLLLLLFIFFQSALFGSVLTGFCFKAGTDLEKLKRDIQFIIISKDKLDLRRNATCIEASLSSKRKVLYETVLIKRGYKIESSYDESVESSMTPFVSAVKESSEHCKMSLETVKRGKSESRDVRLGRKSGVSGSQRKNSSSETMTITSTQGRPALLSFDGKTMYVTCRKISSTLYELEFSLFGKSEGINLVINLSKGSSTEVGEIHKNLADEVKSGSISGGVVYDTKSGTSLTKYYLSVI